MKKRKRRKNSAAAVLLALTVLLTAGTACRDGGYPARKTAAACMAGTDSVTVETDGDGTAVFRPRDIRAGLIFYPGGRVEYTAYAPLMLSCARTGILCVLVKMPLDLAVLDPNAATGIAAQYPEVPRWYIGGHSLGGAMAASCAADHPEDFDGLVLLAAYATKDLSGSGLRVLSLYGSEDGVLNREKYREMRGNLPPDTVEEVIAGGCHAGFGDYGAQRGDGVPAISSREQIAETAAAVSAFTAD